MFTAKIRFVKTSTRIVKYKSQVVKSNPEKLLFYGTVSIYAVRPSLY